MIKPKEWETRICYGVAAAALTSAHLCALDSRHGCWLERAVDSGIASWDGDRGFGSRVLQRFVFPLLVEI